MAYESNKVKNDLKVDLNYGEVDGKVKKRLKTYSGLSLDETVVTSEALVLTAKAMGTLVTPLVENVCNAMLYNNTQVG